VRHRLRQLHTDQSGFSLPELLTSIVIGMIVLMAAAMLFDRAVSGSTQVGERQEATQTGRLGMELISQRLRSQVCLNTTQPVVAGDDNSVTFYSNLTSDPKAIQKRTLRYVASEKRLYEDIVNGAGTYPALTFTGTPTTRELLRPIVQATKKTGSTTVTLPIFRYYKYVANTTTGALQLLGTPLAPADAPEVAMISIAFAALPIHKVERSTDIKDASTFESNVYVRLADPTNPTEGPAC
jgi:prepilin-type N-terminal cleavage/methylation domain-containing protein